LQESIPIEEVFEQLKCTRDGLSSDEGAQRLTVFGPNKLEEKQVTTSGSPSDSSVFFWIDSIQMYGEVKIYLFSLFFSLCCAGEQISQVLGLHVEPTLMGHGDGRYHGYCARQR
jgi:hypothetical protein